MKKLFAATIIMTSLVSPVVMNQSAEAATKLEKKTIVLPKINQTNINQMKKGTYSYHGVRLGMTKKQVEEKIGKTKLAMGSHDKDDIIGTSYTTVYGKSERLWLNFYDINYKTKYNDAKLATIGFRTDDKYITKKEFEKYTGKATEYEGNMKKDKEIVRKYGKLHVAYWKQKGKWVVYSYGIVSPMNEVGMHEYGYKEGRKLPAGVKLPKWITEDNGVEYQ
ncbi:hypothetical protein ETI06_03040 [Macrococcoides goetzii]|nr:hypothetical protein [Macrococcus goetzii]TDM42118.1 hypothetical protein ETI10_03225 [Macrococcus goetzii]TDM47934.1 hypothetical protein ETI08_02010 [Macrococcus goetzii]TDM50973.1 hypothetical protein ETI06_03040 [Macrococcus goetzii]